MGFSLSTRCDRASDTPVALSILRAVLSDELRGVRRSLDRICRHPVKGSNRETIMRCLLSAGVRAFERETIPLPFGQAHHVMGWSDSQSPVSREAPRERCLATPPLGLPPRAELPPTRCRSPSAPRCGEVLTSRFSEPRLRYRFLQHVTNARARLRAVDPPRARGCRPCPHRLS